MSFALKFTLSIFGTWGSENLKPLHSILKNLFRTQYVNLHITRKFLFHCFSWNFGMFEFRICFCSRQRNRLHICKKFWSDEFLQLMPFFKLFCVPVVNAYPAINYVYLRCQEMGGGVVVTCFALIMVFQSFCPHFIFQTILFEKQQV